MLSCIFLSFLGKCEITEISKCEGDAVVNNRKAKLIFFYEWDIEMKWKGMFNLIQCLICTLFNLIPHCLIEKIQGNTLKLFRKTRVFTLILMVLIIQF